MPLFSFKALQNAYRQVQFEEKLHSTIEEAVENADRDIFLFAKDSQIKESLHRLLKDVNNLITKYKMDEKRAEIINKTSSQFKQHVNNYIVNNIKHLPNRNRTQPLPF